MLEAENESLEEGIELGESKEEYRVEKRTAAERRGSPSKWDKEDCEMSPIKQSIDQLRLRYEFRQQEKITKGRCIRN